MNTSFCGLCKMPCNYSVWIAVAIIIIVIIIVAVCWNCSDSGKNAGSSNRSHSPATPGTLGGGTTALICLSGSQEVPPNRSIATGIGRVTLTADQTSINYEIMAMGLPIAPDIGAHFHLGAVGQNGAVVKNLNFVPVPGTSTSWMLNGSWTTADATQPLTSPDVAAFLNGMLYVNLHSAAHPMGEIRAQVVPS